MGKPLFVELDTVLSDGKIQTRLYNAAHIVLVWPNIIDEERCCMWTLDCEDMGIDLDHSYEGVKARLMPALY